MMAAPCHGLKSPRQARGCVQEHAWRPLGNQPRERGFLFFDFLAAFRAPAGAGRFSLGWIERGFRPALAAGAGAGVTGTADLAFRLRTTSGCGTAAGSFLATRGFRAFLGAGPAGEAGASRIGGGGGGSEAWAFLGTRCIFCFLGDLGSADSPGAGWTRLGVGVPKATSTTAGTTAEFFRRSGTTGVGEVKTLRSRCAASAFTGLAQWDRSSILRRI